MKKIVSICMAMMLSFMLVNTSPTQAKENEESVKLQETKEEEIWRIGEEYAEKMMNKSRSGETWKLVSSEKIYEQGAIDGNYIGLVPQKGHLGFSTDMSLAVRFTVEIGISEKISVELESAYSKTITTTYDGPTTEKMPSGKTARGSIFSAITYADIYEYKYKVYDNYSGHYLRDVTVNYAMNLSTRTFNQLVYYDVIGGPITVANLKNTKEKAFASEEAFKKALEIKSYKCINVLEF